MSIPISQYGALETKATAMPAVSGIAQPEDWLRYLFTGGSQPLAGPAVTPSSAMTVPVVAACVALIAGAIGSLPVKVYREIGAGGREEAPEHPAHDLVHDEANEFTDAGQLREQLVVDALLRGNGYALVRRDASGAPIALWRLPPESVSIVVDPVAGPWFRLTTAEGYEPIPAQDMIHVPAPCSLDGINGTAPVQRARNAISLALAMEAHASRIFAKGARPSGILSFPASSPVRLRALRTL